MSSAVVREISEEDPLDLFIVGIKVVNRPYPNSSKAEQHTKAAQYEQQNKRRRDPTDHFTAYIYAHQHTVQLPVEKHFYLRVPETWKVYKQNPGFLNGFLDGLVRTQVPTREFTQFRSTIRASFVRKKHGIGYRPKITNPPTSESRDYLFLHVHCSNPYLYNSLARNLQSHDCRRAFWKKQFYEQLFSGSMQRYLLVWRDSSAGAIRANTRPDPNFFSNPRYLECFVGHEFTKTVNNDTMVLANLGITSNGWIRLTRGTIMDNSRRSQAVSNSRFEVVGPVQGQGIPLTEVEETRCSELNLLSMDIECQSATGEFPQYYNAGDVVNYVGLVKYQLLGDEVQYDCLCLGNTHVRPSSDDGRTVDTAHMHVFQHETQLLNAIPDYVNTNNIDVIHTFNGLNFDYEYLDGRAVLASFAQFCDNHQQFFSFVEQYHKARIDYNELRLQLADLKESFEEYQEISKKEYLERQKEVFKELAEVLGYGGTPYMEPQPRSIHFALWGIWPKESRHIAMDRKRRNRGIAFGKSEAVYNYFKPQPPVHFHYMHRLRAYKGKLIRRGIGSSAIGQEFNKYPDIDRIHLDQFVFFKRSMYRFPSYSLNYVSNHFLKVSKYDMPYDQLFKDYASGNAVKRRKIADYCVQDCDLPRKLDKKTNITMNFIFLFKMTLTPINDLALRGQQIRVFNCLYRKTRSIGAIINSRKSHPILTEYQGATVLPPKVGLHGGPDTWVPVLDFKSLYPSIIIAMLLCMMNLVLPDNLEYVLKLEKEGKIPPLHRIQVTPTQIYYFSKNPNCIIAAELRRLSDKRDSVKRDLKSAKKKKGQSQDALDKLDEDLLNKKLGQAKDGSDEKAQIQQWLLELATMDVSVAEKQRATFRAQIQHWAFQMVLFDLLQLGVKVVMNSFYGFFGVKAGMMPGLQPIAVCTTFYGRSYIERTQAFLFNLFKTHPDYKSLHLDIVYGDTDSVFVKIWPVNSLADAIRIGVDMGERTTRDEFKGSIILEFEKVANPHYALPAKKCYFQRVWTTPEIDKCYIYKSGVVEKRRDNSAFVRNLSKRCSDVIMPVPEKGSTEIPFPTVKSIEKNCALTLQTCLGELEDNVLPLDQYIITKSLSRAPHLYKPPVQAHVALALRIIDRIKKREIVRMPPISGQRLPFVVCKHPSPKVADKVEDVDYLKMKHPDNYMDEIDRVYYLKSCTNSITSLYCAIMDVKPFLAATKSAIEFQARKSQGQTQLGFTKGNGEETQIGARRLNPTRFFVSYKQKQQQLNPVKATKQMTLFGAQVPSSSSSSSTGGGGGSKKPKFSAIKPTSSSSASAAPAPKKKKKPKRRKKKPIKMRPLFG